MIRPTSRPTQPTHRGFQALVRPARSWLGARASRGEPTRARPGARPPLALAVLAATSALGPGCRQEQDAPDERLSRLDGGAEPGRHRLPEWGLSFPLPRLWTTVVPDPSDGPARMVFEAERETPAPAPRFRVAPRLFVSVEPAQNAGPDEAFARVLADLKGMDAKEEVSVERVGFASRTVGGLPAANIRLRYRVDKPRLRVIHRSLLWIRSMLPGRRELFTLTATYLDEDRVRVEPELEGVFQRIELFEPQPADGDNL